MWTGLWSQRAFDNRHRGCCCMSTPETCSSETYQGLDTACAHVAHQRLYFISSSLERPCKVYSSCLVLLTQRPPKCISYQKPDFKAEEKTESKHLKAQMEADNYTQCSRKCHFTIREVCGGDDINTHSRISLPVLLRSS